MKLIRAEVTMYHTCKYTLRFIDTPYKMQNCDLNVAEFSHLVFIPSAGGILHCDFACALGQSKDVNTTSSETISWLHDAL